MVKLEFYATGYVQPKSTKSIPIFPPQMASPDKGSMLEQRNQQDQYFKAASKQKHDLSIYKENYLNNNANYSQSNKFFGNHYDKIKLRSHSDHQTKEDFYSSPRHFSTLRLQQEKVFSRSPRHDGSEIQTFGEEMRNQRLEQQKQARSLSRIKTTTNNNDNLPILNNTSLTTRNLTNQSQQQSNQNQQFIERDHFYVTKPMLRINKDFVDKPLIKNVQVVSEDLPNWCQTTNKYYTPENVDKSKKQKVVVKLDQDIFGNQLKKYTNNFMFTCEPPTQAMRFEKTRMIIADKVDVQAKKTLTKKELMLGKCQLRWDEDISKQRFEARLPLKIGQDSQPYIKRLVIKRNQSQNEFQKIGQLDSYKLEPKEKPIQLKIGHGVPEIINPIKFTLS